MNAGPEGSEAGLSSLSGGTLHESPHSPGCPAPHHLTPIVSATQSTHRITPIPQTIAIANQKMAATVTLAACSIRRRRCHRLRACSIIVLRPAILRRPVNCFSDTRESRWADGVATSIHQGLLGGSPSLQPEIPTCVYLPAPLPVELPVRRAVAIAPVPINPAGVIHLSTLLDR